MKVKNEALRIFLAVTALILTALLTAPSADKSNVQKPIARIAGAPSTESQIAVAQVTAPQINNQASPSRASKKPAYQMILNNRVKLVHF